MIKSSNPPLSISVIVSCFLAGCLEMYDFVIFGFFAGILHQNYLDFLDESSAYIISYMLFAVGFLFRPLGAILFGYLGDKYGRKISLVTSVSMMGIASLAMFLLPTYEMLGVYACYVIALIRVIQGVSVGGEYNGVVIYAIEHFKKKNIGLVASLVTIGSSLGILLATLISKILQHPSLPEYSWRFAFLLGFILSIVGFFIRSKLQETPEFTKCSKVKVGAPLLVAFKKYPQLCIAALFASIANNANVYYAVIFAPSYIQKMYDINVAWLIPTFSILFVPVFGWLGDKFNRIQLLFIASASLVCFNIVFLQYIMSYGSNNIIIFATMLQGVLVAALVSLVNVLVVEIFPAEVRYSAGAFSYSIGATLGGTVPVICAVILDNTNNTPIYTGIYLSFLSVFGIMAARVISTKY